MNTTTAVSARCVRQPAERREQQALDREPETNEKHQRDHERDPVRDPA